jgi:NAD-dependent SIR2 family protein deacetylase
VADTAEVLVAGALTSKGAHTLVLTGAGISLASGIPTFRGGDAGALWATQAMERATFRHFERQPADSWTWYRQRLGTALDAAPNAAHHALTALEAWSVTRGHGYRLVTQNIDPLHERAGARTLIKVHGSIDRARCANPRCRLAATGTTALADLDFSRFDRAPGADTVPRCSACGSLMRPHVLWFDEHYGSHPSYEWPAVLEACETMTLAIAVGTSFSVGVTDLVATAAAQRRVPLVIVDPEAPSIPTGPLAIHVRERAEVCARLGA